MLKSTFSKYLIALVLIIFVSFLMLSGIITSMIYSHSMEDKISKLEMSSTVIADYFEDRNVEQLEAHIKSGAGSSVVTLIPLVNADYSFNIIITDTTGKVLLTTLLKNDDNLPSIWGDLGKVDIEIFDEHTDDEGGGFFVYNGELDGITDESSLVRGTPVMTGGVLRGYVFSLASTAKEDRLISTTRTIVINSSIWVLLAAVIAAFFITEKIVHPLRSMTKAANKFAKGDFSERIVVYGKDEVAQLAIALNRMAESLDNLEKMRNTFLASISHDLRTPMTTISGFIDGINSGAIPEEKHQYYLGVIQGEVHRLSRLVSQLLDLSRLESGDRKFADVNFDIAEIARLIIISFEQKLEQKRLDVSFEAEEDSMIAYADKDSIYQVIYNLCHNAIKFSSEGGKFQISIKRIPDRKILVSVYDEGQTLTDEDKSHIFDRFYKSDKSRGLDKSGVGLGLYICKTIVEAHGEQIYVETDDIGCKFSFTVKEGKSV